MSNIIPTFDMLLTIKFYTMLHKTESTEKHISKGFLSQSGRPTQNALIMYFIYLKYLPDGWNINVIYEPAVQKVRDYFGWKPKSGFTAMIMWGICIDCAKSETSKERYVAMSKAYHDAKGLIGKGYVFTDKEV